VSVSEILAISKRPQSTHLRFGMSAINEPTADFASSSTPQTMTSDSSGVLRSFSAPAAIVWNAETILGPEPNIALAASAAEPCHGVITCQARPPTAVASGLVASQTI